MNRILKKSNRRILLILLMLVPTAVILTTATYAWFTTNKLVTVSPIQVNVDTQGGIQVSADGTNWKSVINIADINKVLATTYTTSVNQIPTTLEPVSTGGNIDASGKMEMYYGTVTTNAGGDYILSTVKTTETPNNEDENGKFVAFDLFFRADSSTELYLTTNSGVKTPDETDTGIKNSTRMAFVVLGNAEIGSTISTIQNLNAGINSAVYLWEPNYNSHTAPAISHAFDTYGIEVDTDSVPYSGVQAAIASASNILVGSADSDNHPTLFKSMNPNYKTVGDFSEYVKVFSLNAGITKVRFYMWIEGQDIDCENRASGGQATFNVQLTTEKP